MPALLRSEELDKPATPQRQEQHTFPYTIESDGLGGSAEIEIVIDRTGRVFFPRVLTATNRWIGYSAATLVSRWRYQPPLKNGQPVHARHTVKIKYEPAKLAASW
jgi:TonB family protein